MPFPPKKFLILLEQKSRVKMLVKLTHGVVKMDLSLVIYRFAKKSSLAFVDADVKESRLSKIGQKKDDVDELARNTEELGGG